MADKKPSWLKISLEVNGELAEAVAEVLARFAPGGVVVESTEISDEIDGPGIPRGDLRVSAYLSTGPDIENTKQKLEESLYFLGMIQTLPAPSYEIIQETNWNENWKQHFKPITIGKKIVIVPSWYENPNPERIALYIDPGMAFGTGTHPTTQLSILLLEDHLKKGQSIFDIGCGSGILSVAAIKLGAAMAFGVDTDQDSVGIADRTSSENKTDKQTIFLTGSIQAIQERRFPIQHAPIVIANILTPILLKLMDANMGDLVSPGGKLLLSGILDEKETMMAASLEKHGYKITEQRKIQDWVGLVAQRA